MYEAYQYNINPMLMPSNVSSVKGVTNIFGDDNTMMYIKITWLNITDTKLGIG